MTKGWGGNSIAGGKEKSRGVVPKRERTLRMKKRRGKKRGIWDLKKERKFETIMKGAGTY